MHLKTSQIIVNARQRIDLGNIDEMVDSMTRLGQITAITVERIGDQYHLIDGMRRLTAAKKMQWETIEVILKENLTELQRQEMELEADIKRKDRTWQERLLAVQKLNTLKQYSDPKWTRQKLADTVGQSVGHVSESMQIAEALKRTQGQTDEWSVKLWNCQNIHEALQHLALRVEDEIYAEIVRRKKAIAFGVIVPATDEAEPPDASNIHKVNITPEPPARRITIYNRFAEQDECQYALIFYPPHLALTSISLIKPDGCAIMWFQGFGAWFETMEALEGTDIGIAASYPLIWNTLKGLTNPAIPFTRSYQCGLFLARPAYRNPAPEAPKPGVMTAPITGPSIPQAIVQQSLDAICPEGVKIWMPFGGPVVEVAQAGRIPVWICPDDETNKETLVDLQEFYKSQYGKVEFV